MILTDMQEKLHFSANYGTIKKMQAGGNGRWERDIWEL